jgi:hypothetical protein
MNKITTYLTKENIFIGLIVSFAFLASSALIGNAIANVQKSDLISVSGTAERYVKSDAGKWTLSVARTSSSEAYGFTAKKMKDDIDTTIKYLVNRGVKREEIQVKPLTASKICASQQQESYTDGGKDCSGDFSYAMIQKIVVQSANVDEIQDLSLNAAQSILAMNGVTIRTEQVEYFYNGLASLRTELLSDAMVNAKERAEALAKSTGNSVGAVKSASQGVFQVTGKNSTEVSDYGSYDTSEVEKKVTAVVRANFSVK